ncbi:hypothetical protein IRB23M11_00770 [Alkalibacterium sp. m-11]|uniref:Methyl-accepting transducer domain-containing protein n=1 Tax=Alkalibacterium indicireducens TaxID=398758 RepID=A0ABP3KV24_9LACT
MNKNKLMVGLASITFGLNVLVHVLHRQSTIDTHAHGGAGHESIGIDVPTYYGMVNGLFFTIPLLLLLISIYLYYFKSNSLILPVTVTLTLTLSVISMIMGGFGAVEYHFGIFMVVATMAYYNSIPLVFLMTGIFAFQHLFGYFFFPATFFVYGPGNYSFVMVLIHAVFLLLTAGAVIWQIASNQQQVKTLEAINKNSEETIQSIISQLTDTSSQVDRTARQLSANANDTQLSSEEVKSSLLSIRSGSEKQVNQTISSHGILDSFSSSIKEIEANSKNIVSSSKVMTTESTEGFGLVEQTTEDMHRLAEAFEQVNVIVSSLDSRSSEISSIITVISEISEKTNLLALNAAIEAAQAGAAGKGFAVVAEEVRKLSTQTDEAVSKVSDIVSTIQSDSTLARDSVSDGQVKMADSLDSVSKTELKFKYILEAVKTLDSDINRTASTSKVISENSRQILQALDLMQEIAEETAAITESTDKQSDRQLQLIKDTTELARSLAGEVEKLNPLIESLQLSKQDQIEEVTLNDEPKQRSFFRRKPAAHTL